VHAAAELDAATDAARARDAAALRLAWAAAERAAASRTTADLNDPTTLRREHPPRGADGRATAGLGASSLLVFAGEDDDWRAREKALGATLADANAGVAAERAAGLRATAEADAAWRAAAAAAATAAAEAEGAVLAEGAAAARSALLMNAALARQHTSAARAASAADRAADRAHAAAYLDSAWMREDRAAAFRSDDPRRPRPDAYKGASVEELKAVAEAQAAQVAEKAAKAAAEREAARAAAAAAAVAVADADAREAAAAAERARAERLTFLFVREQERSQRVARDKARADARAYVGVCDQGLLAGFNKSLR
jgi:hypothetical protein